MTIMSIHVGGFYGALDEVKLQMCAHINTELWEQLNSIDYSDIIY